MPNIIESHKAEFTKIIEHSKKELTSLRTGRAHPSLVENIQVEAYGAKTPLKGLANIVISDPKTLIIEPWDKSILKEIEKTIQLANIGINPINEGTRVRLSMPPLTEENRKELIKILGQKLEQARMNIRGIRDKVREEIIAAFREKEITEDDKYKLQEELDKLVKEKNDEIKIMGEKKEQELMTI